MKREQTNLSIKIVLVMCVFCFLNLNKQYNYGIKANPLKKYYSQKIKVERINKVNMENMLYLNILKQLKINKIVDKNRVTLEDFGAVGDGKTDDTQAITRALNSKYPLIYVTSKKTYYKVSNIIVVKDITQKKIIALNAKILNSDLSKATFLFQNSHNINIEGGIFGYVDMPTKNGGNSQHVLQFDGCENVIVSKIHIINSPEMGIAITNSNKVTVKNSIIEHTYRDGTYSHYSANIKYINNTYKNIKDDAMSFHDYGIMSEKKQLKKYGYDQATNLMIEGNIVENSYQGVGSIGGNKILITGNIFKNTVLAGIAVFNSQELSPSSTSSASNVKITNNKIIKPCSDIKINGSVFNNNGQASTGRAGIFVGSLGKNNQLNAGEIKRLKNVIIMGNRIVNSNANGFWGNNIDNLLFANNNFMNCSGAIPAKSISGDVVEIGNVNKFVGKNNTVIDNRVKIKHVHAYSLNNVSGEMDKWNIKGVISGNRVLVNTNELKEIVNKKSKVE